jgi:ribosomal protein S18 acetylase RimI-like enzyme
MPESQVSLRTVREDRSRFVPLLLEADDVESIVRTYVDDGELCEVLVSGEPVGVVLLTAPEPAAIEIKNIALAREHRGRGGGRAAIARIAAYARACGADRLLAGTADSSTGTLRFYRACGFHDAGRFEAFSTRILSRWSKTACKPTI